MTRNTNPQQGPTTPALNRWHPESRVGLKIGLALLVVIAGTLGTHLALHNPERMLSEQKNIEARTLGQLIESIIDLEMVVGEPERVIEHLELAGRSDNVRDVRVIDRDGVIWYSMDRGERGQKIDRTTEARCAQCHSKDGDPERASALWTNSDGEQIYSYHHPIENKPACHKCHDANHTILGKVLLDMKIMAPDREALSLNRRLASSATLLLVLVFLCTTVIVHFVVTMPIQSLVRTTRMIEAGHYDIPFPKASKDEIGELTSAFQRMSRRVGGLIKNQEKEILQQTQELQASQQLLLHQEKMSALSRLTAGVAHEVGNPLASISAIVQLIERTTKEDETNARAVELNEHVQRISRIVRELVEVYRPVQDSKGWVDLRRSFESALSIARYDRSFKTIEVSTEVSADCPQVFVVEDHILQVLLNLIFNAVDAMPDGGRLELAAHPLRDGVEITIRDTGTGIRPEDADKVFDPFFTTKNAGEGTGLGLWVTFSLLKRAGGTISLDEEAGDGATFQVWIPKSQP